MAKKKKRERERQVWTLVVVWDTIGMLIIWNLFKDIYRLPWQLSSKESVYMQEPQEKWVPSLGWEDPLEECMQPTPLFLPGVFHGQRSPAGYSPWGHKELDTTKAIYCAHTHTVIYSQH